MDIQETTFPLHSLHLKIQKSSNSVHFTLSNTNFKRSRRKFLTNLAFALSIYLSVVLTLNTRLPFHVICGAIIIYLTTQLLGIVDKEELKVIRDFGVEKSATFTFGRRQQVFIPQNNVHRVVINEVIYFVSFIWAPDSSW